MRFAVANITYHIKNVEITPELHDDLNTFSFDKLQDVFKNCYTLIPDRRDDTLLTFTPRLLADLKQLVWYCFHSRMEICLFTTTQLLPELDRICRTFQVHFDGMLCNVLNKYHHFPGFALLLGSLLRYIMMKRGLELHESFYLIAPGMTASLYLVRQWQGHILDDVGFSGIWEAAARSVTIQNGIVEFCAYFAEWLAHVFDQQRYATAAKECLELCLYNHRNFSESTAGYAKSGSI